MPLSPAALALAEQLAEPRELELLVPDRTFSRAEDGTLRVVVRRSGPAQGAERGAGPARTWSITCPDWLRELDGQPITLRGFMYPTYADPVRAFMLARDNQICCFGRNPKPYDLVIGQARRG